METTERDRLGMILSNRMDIVAMEKACISIDKWEDLASDLLKWHESLVTSALVAVSGSEYLYDTIGKKEVPMWYKDTDGRPLIDLDPYGVDMGGKREIRYADKKRYEIRYH